MTKTTAKTFLVVLLSLAASAALSQTERQRHDRLVDYQGQNNDNQGQNYEGGRVVGAPEIDPAQALSALTLLGGTLAIVRGYRRNKR
jgi:hypothetical protein